MNCESWSHGARKMEKGRKSNWKLKEREKCVTILRINKRMVIVFN